MVPVIDCCTREILGWELDHTARAKTAERAPEGALLNRIGWLHGAPPGLALRHDNGLVFGSRLYSSTVRRYGLKQEYIAPCLSKTASASGWFTLLGPPALPVGSRSPSGRLIRTLKEQCVWLHRISSLQHARAVIAHRINQYNTIRPHQALDYLSPTQHLNSPNLPVNKPSHLSSYRRHTTCRRNRVPESGHHFMKEMTCDDRA